jgi:5-methyltetrahydrofolate--homocysteine methyltransferase
MNERLQKLLERGPMITDGAWGTQLQARGLSSGECPDAWNLTHPDIVEEVARAYVDAGSQIVLTNTFGANRFRLEGHAHSSRISEINRRGVELSRRAAQNRSLVFASLGPSGKMLMMGDVTEEELRVAFEVQAQALAEAGADAIVVETMSDMAEAKLAIQAVQSTGLPVVACLVFDSGKDHDRTMMGTTPEQAARELTALGVDVVGANCGQGIEGYIAVCSRMHAATDRPIWIKANAGLPIVTHGVVSYPTSPDAFAAKVPDLIKAGASFIGGCCGTSPDFIRAIHRVLQLKPIG